MWNLQVRDNGVEVEKVNAGTSDARQKVVVEVRQLWSATFIYADEAPKPTWNKWWEQRVGLTEDIAHQSG